MFKFDDKTLRLINNACIGKKHLKLTIGYLLGNDTEIKLYNESGELDTFQTYHYEIGSITKTFTTTLLSKYVLENKMSLGDSIDKYIGELTAEQYYPTLLSLATHTSGYSGILPFRKRECFKVMLGLISGDMKKNNPLNMDFKKMKMLIEKNKLNDVDYSWKYSNFGLSLIGYALGTVSGKGYWDTMNDFIKHELGLHNTYLGISNYNLHGYDNKNNDCGNWQWDKSNLISAAAAISSTAEDLLQYAKMNIFEEKPYLLPCHKKQGNGTANYQMGLGWWISKKNNNVIGNGGRTGCFSSFLCYDKDKKVGVVVLANYRLGMNDEQNIGISLLESLQK